MKLTLSETIHRIKDLMHLNEGEVSFDANEKKIIDDFLNYSMNDLGIQNKDIKLRLQDNKEGIKTTAAYHYKIGGDKDDYSDSEIKVLCFGRALVDILRSIAHELTHHRQYEKGELDGDVNTSSSSPVEKEASAEAGRITKDFIEKNKDKYPDLIQSTELSEDDEAADTTASTSSDSSSTTTSTDSGGGGSYPSVTKWETGLTRGPANQITITIWSSDVSRGPANTIDNSVWDTGITRGKSNTLI